MKAERTSAFSNVIPRRRSKEDHPVPRHHVYTRTLVTHDPVALKSVAETSKESPEDAKRHVPWLVSCSAIAAAENVKTLRDDIVSAKNRRNDGLKSELARLRPELEQAGTEVGTLSASLAFALAPYGLDVQIAHPRTYLDDGLSSLDDLAGEHSLPSPEQKLNGVYGWIHRLTAILGGGALFGFSLGLLTGTLELVSLSEEWPQLLLFTVLGSAVMIMVGASLLPLGRVVGDGLYRIGVTTKYLRHLLPVTYLLLLVGLSISFVVIESKVEMLGLFKALTEDTSLTNTELSHGDLLWVALVLSLPVVASYVVLGMVEGEHRANLCKLLSLQAAERKHVLADEKFASACVLYKQLQKATERHAELETKVSVLEGSIETRFTTEEVHRLEDIEMDAAAVSYAAERELRGTSRESRQGRVRMNWLKTMVSNLIKS